MTCSTCRNFRHGVAARLGFCALDRARDPLAGDEIRACWQPPVAAEPPAGLFAMVEALEAAEAGNVPRVAGPASFAARHPGTSPGDPPPLSPELPPAPARPARGSWVTAEPRRAGRALPFFSSSATTRADRTPPPEGRSVGRLVEAPSIAPALRLGSRGDARAMREAELARLQGAPAVDGYPPSTPAASTNDEGPGLLEGGTVG